MECREAVYSEEVLSYIVGNYLGEDYAKEFYNPDCYLAFDSTQAVVYQQVQSVESETIGKYGFSPIPNLYGLMSQEALEASGVLRLQRQPSVDLYGQGVLIGFVDTGIDYTHEAFRNADNTSRIVAIWDQTVESGSGTSNFPYGEEYTREQINQALASENPAELVPETDDEGHGTFLAGVAAGGENRSKEFSGAAPLSEIIMVKCKQAKKAYRNYYGVTEKVPAYQEDDIMAGISYLLGVARRLRRPIMVCVGMGTSMGSHNGASNLSVLMDRYTTYQGVGMFAAVGNEGNERHHHWVKKKDDTVNINVEGNLNGFMTQLWWRTPGMLTLDIVAPGGEEVNGIRAVSGVRYKHRFPQENTEIEIYFGISQELTREQVVVFRFLSPKTGIWKIRTHFDYDDLNFHMWLPIRQFLQKEVYFLDPSPDITVCNPGTGANLITVSAYDTASGSLYLQAGRGYTVLGNVKPEIVAPGVDVTGTYPKGRYGTMTGTSVSTALAAGIGALFMEYAIQEGMTGVTGITLREIFIRGAVPRGVPYPNTEWGFGIVNAYDSLLG